MKERSPRMAAATLGRASSLPGQPTSVDLRADARFIGQFLLNVNPLRLPSKQMDIQGACLFCY